jgi:hypothetical protein
MRPALRTLSKITRACALLAGVALAPRAAAVDQTGVKISERGSVVGVIAGGDAASATGIAVLRHNPSKRTYTLSIGDAVPTEFGYVLKSVKDRTVVVARGDELETLSFAEPSVEETESVSQTARFIDTYYKSLNADGRSGGTGGEPEPTFVPLSRFGRGADSARSRFELYRQDTERRAGEDAEEFGFETLYDRDDEGEDTFSEPEVIRGEDLSGAVEEIEE